MSSSSKAYGASAMHSPCRVPAHVVEAARGIATATVHEASGRQGALPSRIKPISASFTCCGPALTVNSPPGDNLWIHRALDVAKAGDVLVVYTNGAEEHGYWGEVMATMAKARELGGLVIDACVRDAEALRKMGFPVFSTGLCIRGTSKNRAAQGWINDPVFIGDVMVSAGDLVLGDADGVVCVPGENASAVIEQARLRDIEEADVLRRLCAGESTLDVYGLRCSS